MRIVVLTGAGMSAESGLKTFRDSGGLWEGYSIEEVATPEAWLRNPERVNAFYNERRAQLMEALPNEAHILLARLEKHHDVQIITQNVDDLHERAGSKNVLHIHGELFKVRSTQNANLIYTWKKDLNQTDRGEDGHILRPHIVWFGEAVPMMEPAIKIVSAADMVVIIGTSLQVYPAASLIHYAPKHSIQVYIDKNPSPNIPSGVKVYSSSGGLGTKQWVQDFGLIPN